MKIHNVAMIIARYPPTLGGTEIQCRELSRRLARRGHPVFVVTERYDRSLPATERENGVEVVRLPAFGPPILSAFIFGWALWRWLRKHKEVDVLHAHMLAGPALAALVIGRWLKKPVIVKTAGAGITGDIGTSSRLFRGRLKLGLFKKLARGVACPSAATEQELIALGLAPAFLRRIPNGVDTDRYQPAPAVEKIRLRSALSLPASGPLAVYAGRWAAGKGVESLLSIWEQARARADFQWTLCLLLTRPPTAAQSERLAALGNRVHTAVNVSDPKPYYQASDLAVLLSENEGISNFLLEAMACGLPLLTTPGATLAPAAEAESWGWLVSASETAGILSLLLSLQKDNEQLARKGARARQEVLRAFSTEAVAQAYETFYGDMCAAI